MNFDAIVPLIVAAVFIIGVFIYLTVLKYEDMPTKRAVGFAFLVSAIFIPVMYLFFRSFCIQNVVGNSSVLNGSYTIENERKILNALSKYREKNIFVYIYFWIDTLLLRIGFMEKLFEIILSLNIFLRIVICIALVVIYELIIGKVLNFSESFRYSDEWERKRVQEHNAKVGEYNANLDKVYEHKTTITRDYYNRDVYHVEESTRDVTKYKSEESEPLPTVLKRMLFVLALFFVSPMVSAILFGIEAMLGWLFTKKQK